MINGQPIGSIRSWSFFEDERAANEFEQLSLPSGEYLARRSVRDKAMLRESALRKAKSASFARQHDRLGLFEVVTVWPNAGAVGQIRESAAC